MSCRCFGVCGYVACLCLSFVVCVHVRARASSRIWWLASMLSVQAGSSSGKVNWDR